MQQAGQRARFERCALREIHCQRLKRPAEEAVQAQLALPAPDYLEHFAKAGVACAQRKRRQQKEERFFYVSQHGNQPGVGIIQQTLVYHCPKIFTKQAACNRGGQRASYRDFAARRTYVRLYQQRQSVE